MGQAALKLTGELQGYKSKRSNAFKYEDSTSERMESPTRDDSRLSQTPVSSPSTTATSANEPDMQKHQQDLFDALQAAEKESDEKFSEYRKAAEAADKVRYESDCLNKDLRE